MTFMDWCLKAPDDGRPMRVTVTDKVYEPDEIVPIEEVNHLKMLKIKGRPKLIDGVWHVQLG